MLHIILKTVIIIIGYFVKEGKMKSIIVTAAILTNEDQYLCMQRSDNKLEYLAYKYEFPGGKLEIGESPEDCLMREIHEEMGIEVEITKEDFFMTIDYTYPDFIIEMHCYMCPVKTREFELKEHESFVWLSKDDLMALDWAAADIPAVEKIMKEC